MGGPGTAGTGASGILGRSDELAALRLALAATPGQGSTLVLRGEPGVGKSALLDDVARQTREAGWQLLRTDGTPGERRLPYSPHSCVMPAATERTNTPHEQTSGMSTKRRRQSPDSSSPLLSAA